MIDEKNATRSRGESDCKTALRSNCSTNQDVPASLAAALTFAPDDAGLMPLEPGHVENVRKLEAAGASRWCGYRLTAPKANGKRGKQPLARDGGGLIGTNAPELFYSLDDALALVEAGKADGVGLLMSSAPGLVAIDLDECISPDGQLAGWAAGIVERFSSFTEVSVSGTGLHIHMLAQKPPGCGERVGGIEVYDASSTRFLTVSGKLWRPELGTIEARQAELENWLIEIFSAGTGGGGGRAGVGVGSAGQVNRVAADAANDGAEGQGSQGAAPAPAAEIGAGNRCVLRENEEVARLVLAANNSGGLLQRMIRDSLTDAEKQQFRNANGSLDQSRIDQAVMYRIAWITHDVQQCVEVFEDIAPDRVAALAGRKGKHRVPELLRYSAKSAVNERQRKGEPTYDELQAEKARKAEQTEQRQVNFSALLAGGLGSIEVSRSGKVRASLANLQEVIGRAHALAGVFAFDEFADVVVKLRQLPAEILPPVRKKGSLANGGPMPLDDDDLSGVMLWVARNFGADYQLKQIQTAINAHARHSQINLVAGVLDALVWDGQPRLDSWLVDFCNADTRGDGAEYVAAVGRKFLIQAVARAFIPGCKADAVLILEGPQGARKSSAVRVLGTAIAPHTFRENLPDLRGVDSRELQLALRGAWIAELQELKALRSASAVEHIKAVVTTAEDNYRAPYEIFPRVIVRTSVFIGTVNPDGAGYLNDPTGGRRYWPVAVSNIDVEGLAAVAPQLFAEAVAAYKAGEPWYWAEGDNIGRLATAAIARRMPVDAWDDVLRENLASWAGQAVSLADIWVGGLKFANAAECDGPRAARLARALRQLGCKSVERDKKRLWLIPPDLGKN